MIDDDDTPLPSSLQDATPERRTPPRAPLTGDATLRKNHHLFIASPAQFQPIDCDLYTSPDSPHQGMPRSSNDHTSYPERYSARLTLLEVLQGPPYAPSPRMQPPADPSAPPEITFAIGLGPYAFHDEHAESAPHVYDRAYCERINALFASPYLVLHAFPIRIERGNSPLDLSTHTLWHSLGTDPSKRNAGFQTLEEARAYAETLLTPEAGAP